MEFVILGRTELRVDGAAIDLGAAKQRGLLALLLYHVGVPVRPDVLVEHLWPGRRPEECRTNLYTLISRLRAVLQRVDLPNALARVPSTGAYRLDVPPRSIDFHRFRAALSTAREAARDGHHDGCVALLRETITTWRDEPLADLRGEGAEQLRATMEDALVQAYKCMGDSQLQIGQYDSVLLWLEPFLRRHDLDETLAQQWITALCATGRETEARAFLGIFRQRFRKTMRAEPSIEMPISPRRAKTASGQPGAGPASEPPAGSDRPRQLPNDITDFAGQHELLAELDLLTDPSGTGPRVVVISGMPGAGKTTLAVHWAHRQRHRFPDGQLFLNAGAYGPSPAVEPAGALGQLLHTLGVPPDRIPAGVEQRRDRVSQLLAGRRMLLVLDNVQDSVQVRPLLPTSDTCLTVITSRNRLRGLSIREGVRNLTVPPLPDDACLELLSRAIGAGRAQAEPIALRAMIRLSGGLPLAVRIIGEHVATRPRAPISELVDELRTRLLDCEGEDEEDATLRTVFAWSYHALRPDPAELFDVLGLYPGETISAEAAAALNGTPPQQTEQLLDTLAKAHLINHDTVRRYRLHDLLRRYAADRAARDEPAGRTAAAARRMLDWFLLTAVNAAAILAPQEPAVPDLPEPTGIQPQTFASDVDAMKWCAAERGNLGALTRWAVEHGWHRHGWQIPGTVQEMFDRYGRQDDVRELQETALRSARMDGHRIGELGILNNLAASYFAQHDYARAAASFTAGLDLAHELGDIAAETIYSHNLASARLATGDTATAVTILHQVLRPWRELGNAPGEASTLHRLGDAHRLMGRYEEAVGYYQEAMAIRERIGSLRGQGATHGELAALFLETGQLSLALEHCRRALAIHDQTKDDVARCDALSTMADIQRETGLRHESIRNARLAVALSGDIADSLRRCRALTILAEALAQAGQTGAAERAGSEALTILADLAAPGTQALRDRLRGIQISR